MSRRQRRRESEPWYTEGLRFRCTACGVCCTGEPGHVWVTPAEIAGLADAKGLSVSQFKKRFVRRVGRRFSLREHKNGDCAMLEAGRCSVYEAKPTRCSTYPFWTEVLAHPEEWDENSSKCEGIGQGDHYTFEEIEQVRAGDPAPLLEKHARPPETPVVTRYRDGKRLETPERYGPVTDEIDWDGAFAELERIYADLERELPKYEFTCAASGNCCDFDAYGHRLYVTTLEAEYFFRTGPTQRANDDATQCPQWGTDRLCKARDARMLGCRTYFCGPYPVESPDALHERFHAKILRLHVRYGIDYQYRDVRDWDADRKQPS